jgi:hypothetical protein
MFSGVGNAAEAPAESYGKLPIKEITVFKDGNALVAHEGEMPVDEKGNVAMDYLPAPVMGTFWPYAADPRAKLIAVRAGQKRIVVDHTALSIRELLEANVGAQAIIEEAGTNRYEATILELPSRSAEELTSTSPPNTPERLPEKGNLLLLKTSEGTKVVNVDRIQQITFKDAPRSAVHSEEFRNILSLQLDWGKKKAADQARVGLFYLQRGIRWIPSYKVEIDGNGKALVKFQATLINELADLQDVSVNLVVGVPTFAFKDSLDPISLQQNLASLSPYFQTDTGNRNSPLASQFSNAIMSQAARVAEYRPSATAPSGDSLGPEIGDAGKNEDLFIFNVQHVTLKRGERMVLPVAEFELTYKDVFTLDLPFAPPPEVRGNLNGEQQRELARLLNSPKVFHKLRLTNKSKYPLTTAPALIVKQGQILAQGLITYTAIGSQVDLSVTTALDIQAKKSELETKRTPNAMQENGNSYSRIDLSGRVNLTNLRSAATEIEITRYVMGAADQADHDGSVESVNRLENGEFVLGADLPAWWNWYSWPYWWNSFNGVGRITWKLTLEPKQSVELGYQWHYFWR